MAKFTKLALLISLLAIAITAQTAEETPAENASPNEAVSTQTPTPNVRPVAEVDPPSAEIRSTDASVSQETNTAQDTEADAVEGNPPENASPGGFRRSEGRENNRETGPDPQLGSPRLRQEERSSSRPSFNSRNGNSSSPSRGPLPGNNVNEGRRRGNNPRSNPAPGSMEGRMRGRTPGGTNSSASQGLAAFKIIWDRNVFDPNRRPPRPEGFRDAPRPRRSDFFTLVGTLLYEQGAYAFFDSVSAEYRKVLEPGKTIAGYQIIEIGGNSIKLQAGTNTIELQVGRQMRREEGKAWQMAGAIEAPVIIAESARSAASEGAGAGESDLVKRMMQRRQQEK